MERVGVRELNQETSRVLARVRDGESIEITERGVPIARLVPVADDNSVFLNRLVALGVARAPRLRGTVPLPPVLGDPLVDAAAELAAAREDERW